MIPILVLVLIATFVVLAVAAWVGDDGYDEVDDDFNPDEFDWDDEDDVF